MAVFLVRKPKCVFIHIPKTGGASIRRGFFQDEVDGPKQGFVPVGWLKHFKFAFVRHPHDRLISAWKMFSLGMDNTVWEQPDKYRGISLPEFMDVVVDESIGFGAKRRTAEEKIRHHTIPQTHPFNCLHYADFIGRFESLENDFAKVCARLGIEFSGLPNMNQSRDEARMETAIDDATRQRISQYYADDFKKLNYRP